MFGCSYQLHNAVPMWAAVVFFVLLFGQTTAQSEQLAESDQKAMLKLYRHWVPTGWFEETDPCTWEGVVCHKKTVEGYFSSKEHLLVTSISVNNVCEHAVIVHDETWTCDLLPEIGQLKGLEFLYLNGNGFQGTIPDEIGNLMDLKSLYLNSNQLWGEIPYTIGKLKQLEKLHLNANTITGEIPQSIGKLSNLHQLELQNNDLEGPIPDSIGELKELVQLDLNNNQLEGSIPASLSGLTHLHRLNLQSNMLEGHIPEGIFTTDMNQLSKIDLGDNHLTGYDPTLDGCHVSVATLVCLLCQLRCLTRFVPLGLCKLDHLAVLILHGNQLEGTVPHCDGSAGLHADAENRRLCEKELVNFCGRLTGANHQEL